MKTVSVSRLAVSLLFLCGMCGSMFAQDIPELSSVLSLFSAHATADDGVRLNWTLDKQSPTIIKFRIYRGYEEVGNFAVLTDVNANAAADSVAYSFRDATAKPGVTYYYKLAALGQKSESVFPVVITATATMPGQSGPTHELVPAAVLAGDKIVLYVRKAGQIKLDITSAPAKALVNDSLKPGIYEFDPPAGGNGNLSLHLEYGKDYRVDVMWPVR
jgi:hypothetical protein